MYKLIAHRGNTKSSKENTIAAFFDALNDDYYGFECDVRGTKDGKFVIYHDPLYKGKLVKSYEFSKLENDGLISIKDVLKINTTKMILIDIKDPFINIDEFIKILSEYKNKNLYVMSFYDSIIRKLFTSQRTYKVGILNYVLNTEEKHFEYDFLCVLGSVINKKIIDKYRKLGKDLFVYGINRKDISDYYPYYIVD